MALVEAGKDLKQVNVLSLRKKMIHEEIKLEILMIEKFLQNNGITKRGPVVTTTHSIEAKGGQPLLDIEIIVPIDKPIDIPGEYVVIKSVVSNVLRLY